MFYPFFFDPTMVLVIPALLLAMWAQFKVKSTYTRFARVSNRAGLTGADVAARILRDGQVALTSQPEAHGGRVCGLECIGGQLTDHYDPRSRTLRLSQEVYHGRSVAALGIAAHEVGHALQHADAYAPLALRSFFYPLSSIGSSLAFPLFILGFFLPVGLGHWVIQAAIALFMLALLFTLITLPVEFNASRRALKALANGGYLAEDELSGARKVLGAAAMTYVAAALMAVMQLIRMLLLAQSRD